MFITITNSLRLNKSAISIAFRSLSNTTFVADLINRPSAKPGNSEVAFGGGEWRYQPLPRDGGAEKLREVPIGGS